MPAESWTTPAQLAFLNDKRLDFSNGQRERRLSSFWPAIFHDFFALWPNRASEVMPDPDGASKKKKKKASKAVDEAETV
jgi:hypothetical protein